MISPARYLLFICLIQSAHGFPVEGRQSGVTLTPKPAPAQRIRVAVASNFIQTFKKIETAFEESTTYDIEPSYGSTGQLAAQILQGAPFDIFLAADQYAIDKLVRANTMVNDSRATYACGRLVLASLTANPPPNQTAVQDLLNNSNITLAIANPKLAPYGYAATEVMESLKITHRAANQIIWGQNIGQVFHYVASGNVQWGFIAASQAQQYQSEKNLSVWPVAENLHSPIRQEVGITQNGESKPGTRQFARYLQSDQARKIILDAGYAAPHHDC